MVFALMTLTFLNRVIRQERTFSSMGNVGGGGYNSKTLYRFWTAKLNENGKEFSIGRDSGVGKRFLRMLGSTVYVHGEFLLRGNHIYNHNKPYTVNIGSANQVNNGESYEFLNKLIGRSLVFCFGAR